jgi:hypothetical protein
MVGATLGKVVGCDEGPIDGPVVGSKVGLWRHCHIWDRHIGVK